MTDHERREQADRLGRRLNGDGEGLSALALACQRCSFVRLHAAQLLDQYVDFP